MNRILRFGRPYMLQHAPPQLLRYLRFARPYVLAAYKLIVPTQRGGWPLISAAEHRVAASVWFRFLTSNQYFGRILLYQSCEPLGLPGQRPTKKRARIYGFDALINADSRVLDVGSNLGCLSLEAARRGREVVGIEVNEDLLWMAETIRKHCRQENVRFLCVPFEQFEDHEKFDVILASAVHKWIGMSIEVFIAKIEMLLKRGGVIVFESNNYQARASEFEAEIQTIINAGFVVINSGISEFDVMRKFYVLRRIK